MIAINANGNPLHPTEPQQGKCLKDTIRLAGDMGIKTVCTMSGLPAGSAGDLMPNWVVSSWPPATQEILRYQLEEKLLPFWEEIVALAKECGVERIALELQAINMCTTSPRSCWASSVPRLPSRESLLLSCIACSKPGKCSIHWLAIPHKREPACLPQCLNPIENWATLLWTLVGSFRRFRRSSLETAS